MIKISIVMITTSWNDLYIDHLSKPKKLIKKKPFQI